VPPSPTRRPNGPSAKRLTASRHPLTHSRLDTGRLLRRTGSGRRRHARARSQPGWTESARARFRAGNARVARTGKLAPLLPRLVVHVIECRGEPATMRRAVTHQAPATTRRRRLPLSTSSGHGYTARHDPQAHRLRARSSPAQCSASRCGGGAGRWAIRWATPCRIGPYQAQRRAPTVATVLAGLQAFRGLSAPRTPCFTRERSQVRNPPRPSTELPANQHVSPARASADSRPGNYKIRRWAIRWAKRRPPTLPPGVREPVRAPVGPGVGPTAVRRRHAPRALDNYSRVHCATRSPFRPGAHSRPTASGDQMRRSSSPHSSTVQPRHSAEGTPMPGCRRRGR
jgi:hypothetical protein